MAKLVRLCTDRVCGRLELPRIRLRSSSRAGALTLELLNPLRRAKRRMNMSRTTANPAITAPNRTWPRATRNAASSRPSESIAHRSILNAGTAGSRRCSTPASQDAVDAESRPFRVDDRPGYSTGHRGRNRPELRYSRISIGSRLCPPRLHRHDHVVNATMARAPEAKRGNRRRATSATAGPETLATEPGNRRQTRATSSFPPWRRVMCVSAELDRRSCRLAAVAHTRARLSLSSEQSSRSDLSALPGGVELRRSDVRWESCQPIAATSRSY